MANLIEIVDDEVLEVELTEVILAASGATQFTGLTDVPSSYSGASLKVVRVNAGESGLEFSTATGGGINNVVEDLTPQLGGDLDAVGFNIKMDANDVSTISPTNRWTQGIYGEGGNPILTFGENFPSATNPVWAAIESGEQSGEVRIKSLMTTPRTHCKLCLVPGGEDAVAVKFASPNAPVSAYNYPKFEVIHNNELVGSSIQADGYGGPVIEQWHATAGADVGDQPGSWWVSHTPSRLYTSGIEHNIEVVSPITASIWLTPTIAGDDGWHGKGLAVGNGVLICGATNFGSGSMTYKGVGTLNVEGAVYCPTIELGNASDTTIARSGSGTVTIEGNTIATLTVENQALTGGVTVTEKDLGTVSSGTTTLDLGDRPMHRYTNNGAHTLAPGTTIGSSLIAITNAASAGAITTSGWTKVAGDSFTTTNGHKFLCAASVSAVGSLLTVQAMQ